MISPLASSFRGGWRNLTPMRARGRGGQNPWTPGELSSLRAWYDAELGQPKNVGYVQLDGTAGDYIYTPDSVATSFNNDIEVVMRVKVTDWTAASAQTLVGKYVTASPNRSWRFYVSAAGAISLSASTDGGFSTVTTVSVTPTNALPDNTWIWLRMRLDLTNGSNSIGTLETAADTGNNIEPSSWTANGTANGPTISGIFDSTAATEIGAFSSGATERLSGQVGRCIVRSGFDGTTVADFNASDCYGDGYWHSDGYRWNLGLPKVYDRSGNNVAPATFGSGSNQPKWLPWLGRSNVYTPGASNNHVSTSTSAALRLTTSLEMEVIVDDEIATPASNAQLIGNVDSGAAGGYALRMSTTRALLLVIYNGSFTTYTSTSTSALSARQFKVTLASGVVRFYTAGADGVYSQLGSDVVAATAPAAGDGTVNTLIGAGGNGTTEVLEMRVRRAIIRDAPDGTMVADFNAELCGQTGYTDSLGNVWTVNRSTSGRKTVVQSPAARSARSVIQGATDDRLTVPLAALPTFGTSGVGSVLAVQRKWATLGTNDRVFDSKASTSATAAGFYVGSGGTAADLVANAGDGTNQANSTAATAITSGQRQVVGITVSATQIQAFVNNTFATAASRPTSSMDSGGDLTVFANSTGAEYSDGVLEAIISRDAEQTPTEQGLTVAYYGGGL